MAGVKSQAELPKIKEEISDLQKKLNALRVREADLEDLPEKKQTTEPTNESTSTTRQPHRYHPQFLDCGCSRVILKFVEMRPTISFLCASLWRPAQPLIRLEPP